MRLSGFTYKITYHPVFRCRTLTLLPDGQWVCDKSPFGRRPLVLSSPPTSFNTTALADYPFRCRPLRGSQITLTARNTNFPLALRGEGVRRTGEGLLSKYQKPPLPILLLLFQSQSQTLGFLNEKRDIILVETT